MTQDLAAAANSIRSDALVDVASMTTFVAVISESSFTHAARRVGVSKSVISRRISDLETQLGAALIDRSALRVRPTEVGAVYYAKCVRILESIESANDFVTNFNGGVRGSLRALVPKCFNVQVAGPIFSEFATLYPDLRLEVSGDDGATNLLDSGFDLALRVGALPESGMVAKTVAHCHYWLCASPGYLKVRGKPEAIDDLSGHIALLHTDTGGSGWVLSNHGEDCILRLPERMRSDCYFQLLEAAKAGLGMAMLPTYMVEREVAAGTLEIVLPQCSTKARPIWLEYPPSRRGSLKVQAIIGFLSDKLSGISAWATFAANRLPS